MSRRYDLVIVGVGSGGLVAADFAATLGLRVAAVEAHRIGGDCLWTGCVPSKALLASAKVAHHMRRAAEYGIRPVEPDVDLEAVWARIRSVQDAIATTDDSPEHLEAKGVEVVHGAATIVSAHEVEVGGRRLDTRFILIATGSRPAVPDIDGLAEAGYLTSETLFELERPPASLVVVGGGPIGVELAQGCRRLGLPVTLLQRGARLLPRDEPELTKRVPDILRREGVEVQLDADLQRVRVEDGSLVVHARLGEAERTFRAGGILVAAGRTPNVDALGLAQLGIEVGPSGIVTDARSRTSVASIYAVGDVTGRQLFTHAAANQAAAAVRDMFFPGAGRPSALVPWCTFTDPELASVGLTAGAAAAQHGAGVTRTWTRELRDSDRARADGATDGAIVLVTAKEKLVGAHVLAPAAGEMIQELALAIDQGLKLRDLASLVHVYPTVATGIQQLAGEAGYERAKRFGWLVRRETRRG